MEIKPQAYFSALKGFKISKAHFELGSNLHISEYFYVKRLFYNSFYTNRFAYLITQKILTDHEALLAKLMKQRPGAKKDAEITLLGFENYADLLVSNVRKMLNDYLRIKHMINYDFFNHDIFTKESSFLKNPKKIVKYIIQIFPISTTFSTSIRIQAEIREIANDQNLACKNPVFIDPVINGVIIASRKPDQQYDFASTDIEYDYGWRRISPEKRVIDLEIINSRVKEARKAGDKKIPRKGDEISQSYMIALVAKWQRINECEECYPDSLEAETCLIETKATPVTPNLIFGYPVNYDYGPTVNIFPYLNIRSQKGKEESLIYRRHFKKYDNHYIYYIRIGRFLQENLKAVKTWLGDLYRNTFIRFADEPIVIVTPTLGSNSGFVNLLNDIVFSDTATIIQYNPKEEFLENFILFYADTISKAKKVIFVDDAIATTQTILDINFFIRHVREDKKGLDFCVTLINRVGYYNYVQLLDKLHENDAGTKCVLSYLDVNVTPLPHRNKFPYMSLMEKFRDLSTKSVLDSMKMHFRHRARYFRPIDLATEYKILGDEDQSKSLLQFLVMHEVSNLFRKNESGYLYKDQIRLIFEDSDGASWQHLRDFFMRPNSKNSVESFRNYYPQYKHEIKNALFKVCTCEPFLQNKKIKEAVFKWVLHDLIAMVSQINTDKKVDATFFQCKDTDGQPAAFSPYQHFRFLLKRGAKLKMNFIYDIDTLKAIKHVLVGIEKYKYNYHYLSPTLKVVDQSEFEIDQKTSKAIVPIGFITYYVALLQELIIEHESKALQVVINIKKIIDEKHEDNQVERTLKNSYNDHFIYLLRMLVLENTFIFHTSSERFLTKNKTEISFADQNYTPFLKKLDAEMETYPFNYTVKMLSGFVFNGKEVSFEEEPGSMIAFRKMMLLKALLQNDSTDIRQLTGTPIELKLKEILKIACEILKIQHGGAMFAVKYKNMGQPSSGDDIHVVSSYTCHEKSGFSGFEFTKDSLLFKIFDGVTEQNSKNSISSLELTMDDRFKYHFRLTKDINRGDLHRLFEFEGELFRKLFYLRITRFAFREEQNNDEIMPQAVICFFDDKLNETDYVKAREILTQKIDPAGEQQELYKEEAEVNTRGRYERLDPKKVRQLLLLRNDLSKFITHHFDNDSLRAYIEQLKNKQLYRSLSHGTSTYEKLIDYYLTLLETEKQAANIEGHTKYLRASFSYLINKLHLLSAANKLFDDKSGQTNYEFEELTIGRLIDEFKEQCRVVITMKQPNLNRLESEADFVVDDSTISNSARKQDIYLYYNLLKEMVFEILYNIKKHCINRRHLLIKKGPPLKITITILYANDLTYLRISNNYSIMKPDYIAGLNNKLIKSDSLDGLNLIYNIINKTANQRLFLDTAPGELGVNIPLKIK